MENTRIKWIILLGFQATQQTFTIQQDKSSGGSENTLKKGVGCGRDWIHPAGNSVGREHSHNLLEISVLSWTKIWFFNCAFIQCKYLDTLQIFIFLINCKNIVLSTLWHMFEFHWKLFTLFNFFFIIIKDVKF